MGYNFKVEDFHTYFVSDLDVLVHNACGDLGDVFQNPATFADEIQTNPQALWGKSAEDIKDYFQNAGYTTKIEASTKGSRKSLQVRIEGHPQIANIQVHPGGGRHGGSYYKISTSTQGKIKIVDSTTYVPTPGEKVKIITIN